MNKEAAKLVNQAKDAIRKYREENKELQEKIAKLTASNKTLKDELALERSISDYICECNEKGLFPPESNVKIAKALREASEGNIEKFASVKRLMTIKISGESEATQLGTPDTPTFIEAVDDKKSHKDRY